MKKLIIVWYRTPKYLKFQINDNLVLDKFFFISKLKKVENQN